MTELKFGDLYVHFGKPAEVPAPVSVVPQIPAPDGVTDLTPEQHKQNDKDALEENARIALETRIAELNLTNPLEAERLIAEGELADGDDESGDVDDEAEGD